MTAGYLFFSGGACALLLLAATKVAIHHYRYTAGRWLLAMLLGIICYLLWPTLPQLSGFPALLLNLPITLVPAAFWVFTHLLCREEESFPTWGWIPIGITLIIGIVAHHAPLPLTAELQSPLFTLSQLLKLGLISLGLLTLQRQFNSDLVEERRRLRTILLIAVGAYMLVVIAAESLFAYRPVPSSVPLLHALLASLLALIASLWLFALSPSALGESLPKPKACAAKKEGVQPAPPPPSLDHQQQGQLQKLQEHMQNGGYRHTGLTIRELAEQLDIREHILRVLINRHLGYRNFNEYLNQFRIDEASTRLATPEQAHLPVLTIALDIGYRSLSPFNAAFKRRHNQTPTEYRRERLPA
ncbi:helix-turn-helix transcriptional regulator [Microbulbifer sp. OS29]|uniref:Helix-turn-helix transcriptional regulator n=1 Tax=Microbulbifer okhotskensis TaxID=2926617 RepID=A0A9X2ENT9_9GAMM|nr:helix-turn-helix transcriptional regulator [Microbulbifer okhotskensis]MCO1335627.1 helix-turn-helix transcriptional regulator [Microbulbifer okhotskensis]